MSTAKLPIHKYKNGTVFAVDDPVAVEEPLEIFIDGFPFSITMRTPGRDADLALGICLSEGVVDRFEDVDRIHHCESGQGEGRIHVHLKPGAGSEDTYRTQRGEYMSGTSCGVCGKTSLEDVYADIPPVPMGPGFTPEEILQAKDRFEAQKDIFNDTGGTHSASLFGPDRELITFAEDVGRHNAFDKAIGAAAAAGMVGRARMAMLSSRLSFEMVQKAGVARIGILAGVSAPTSLAVRFAHNLGITLAGFVRRGRMNIYTHPERILGDTQDAARG